MHESDSLMIANQIQGLRTEVPGGLAMSFGDIRVARRADWMIERVAAMGNRGAAPARGDARRRDAGVSVSVVALRFRGPDRQDPGRAHGGTMRRSPHPGSA